MMFPVCIKHCCGLWDDLACCTKEKGIKIQSGREKEGRGGEGKERGRETERGGREGERERERERENVCLHM